MNNFIGFCIGWILGIILLAVANDIGIAIDRKKFNDKWDKIKADSVWLGESPNGKEDHERG